MYMYTIFDISRSHKQNITLKRYKFWLHFWIDIGFQTLTSHLILQHWGRKRVFSLKPGRKSHPLCLVRWSMHTLNFILSVTKKCDITKFWQAYQDYTVLLNFDIKIWHFKHQSSKSYLKLQLSFWTYNFKLNFISFVMSCPLCIKFLVD